MIIKKLSESYFFVDPENEQIKVQIMKTLTIVDEASKFKPKYRTYGMDLDSFKFYRTIENGLVIPTGLIPFLSQFGITLPKEEPEFSIEELNEYLNDTIENVLPFKPYKHQTDIFIDSVMNYQQMAVACTGSGKSMAIALLANFMLKKNKKVLIIVPSISLVTQIHKDFLDYNLTDLYNNVRLIGGENKVKSLEKPITISTWQSLQKMDKALFKEVDVCMIDECHGLKVDTKVLDIVLSTSNAKYRIGMTGTLPEAPQDKMSIFSVVGKPKVYIRTSGLIKMGLATPLKINIIKLKYDSLSQSQFKGQKTWPEQLAYIKEHENRNLLISRLSLGVASKTGNTVIMCSHVQHMTDLFLTLMKERYPDVEVENKNIVGKKAFEFQQQHRIYYINGGTEAKQREHIRNILEHDHDAILVSNYQLMSTGINIKKLANIVLASPLKSYTTITQALGRAIRLHVSKDAANVYDFVDMFTDRCVFAKQFEKRLTLSYKPEGFEINERTISI